MTENDVIGAATDLILSTLLDKLGITLDLKDVPCNRGTAPYIPVDSNGWNKGIYVKYLFDTVENVCKQNRWWDRFPTHVRYIFTFSNGQLEGKITSLRPGLLSFDS